MRTKDANAAWLFLVLLTHLSLTTSRCTSGRSGNSQDQQDSLKLCQQHLSGILNVLLRTCKHMITHMNIRHTLIFTKKVTASLPSNRRWSYVKARYIICTMLAPCSYLEGVTYRSNLNLAIDNYGAILDGVQSEHSSLREIDDRGSHHGAKDTAIADCVCSASHVFYGQLTITSLGGWSATGHHVT
jgi:hypothetical protein